MERGDISNQPQQRLLFQWENLLATLEASLVRREARLVRRGKWDKALSLWEPSRHAWKVLNDLCWRRQVPVDVFTTHPQKFADRLAMWMDEVGYPYNRIIRRDSQEELASELPFMLEVQCVYYGEVTKPFVFGSRGACIPDINDIQRWL